MSTTILIADDQEDVRSGFRMILDAQPDLRVIAEAADGQTALDQARLVRPDVVLADIRMPRLDGLELTRRLVGSATYDDHAWVPRVIVVTTFDLDEYVELALRHGASGFLLKRSGPTLLIEAIRAAMAGDTLISPQLTVRLLRHTAEQGSTAEAGDPDHPLEPLTERELDVVRAVAVGMTNAEIGAELFVSAGTIKTHLAHIARKLPARNRVEIAAWAWRTRIV